MASTETLPLTDCELIDSLRRFPTNVLPVAVLRELTQRGPRIQDELLRRLEKTADEFDSGIGSTPGEAFYCFSLLLAHPTAKQLPTLEKLLRLDDGLYDVTGDLEHELVPTLLVEIAKVDGQAVVMEWLKRLIKLDSIRELSRANLLSSLSHLVHDEVMPRYDAMEVLVGVLVQRKGRRFDELSAFAIDELSKLGAVEHDGWVRECFNMEQIDDSIINLSNWERAIAEFTPNSEFAKLQKPEQDLIERMQRWWCFSGVSNSLDPFAESEPNPNRHEGGQRVPLTDVEIELHFQSIQNSHDNQFPKEAVNVLGRYTQQVKDQLIEEVRNGLERAGGPDARLNNAPFLALVLLIADRIRVPRDILLRIIDLPEEQRFDLFGDAMDDAIVVALSISLCGDTAPIDSRILDPERNELDRTSLANFYPLSAYRSHLTRSEAIDALFSAWQVTSGNGAGHSTVVSDALLN